MLSGVLLKMGRDGGGRMKDREVEAEEMNGR